MKEVSYGEILMKKILDRMYPNEEYIDNYRPKWLENPENIGNNLELDRYYPRLNRAYEFNGESHFKKNYVVSRRDNYKKHICQRMGVFLTIIYPYQLTEKARQQNCKDLIPEINYYLKRQRKKHPFAKSLKKRGDAKPIVQHGKVICYNIANPKKKKVIFV